MTKKKKKKKFDKSQKKSQLSCLRVILLCLFRPRRGPDPVTRCGHQREQKSEAKTLGDRLLSCSHPRRPPGQPQRHALRCLLSPQHRSPSFLLLFSLHIVPILNFFVPGATSRFLQLFMKAWPLHLLYSQAASLSSPNLPASRDPRLQPQSDLQSPIARWPLHSDSHCSVKSIFPMQSP